jgi:predicted protein tyrosine phosphatase
MHVEELGRHIYVCSLPECPDVLKRDPNFWNIISIYEPETPRATLRGAKKIHYVCFHDVENVEKVPNCRPPRQSDLASIFQFVDSLPYVPMLIHCRAGLSRSPAVALSLVVRALVASVARENLVDRAVEALLSFRPPISTKRVGSQTWA